MTPMSKNVVMSPEAPRTLHGDFKQSALVKRSPHRFGLPHSGDVWPRHLKAPDALAPMPFSLDGGRLHNPTMTINNRSRLT